MRRYLIVGSMVCVAGLLLSAGCQGFFETPGDARPVQLRIENDTAELLEVRIRVESLSTSEAATESSSAPSDDSAGRDLPTAEAEPVSPADSVEPVEPSISDVSTAGSEEEPAFVSIGLRPADQAAAKDGRLAARETLSEDVVRVSARDFSDGVVTCGDLVTLTASLVGSSSISVSIGGVGSGTLGFDEGSVGPSGERMLLGSVHFECGDAVVLRVTGGAGSGASGEVEVFDDPATVPSPVFDEPASNDDATTSDEMEVRIDNQTASFVQLHVLTGAAAVLGGSADSEASNVGLEIRVPPGFLSTGVVECATRMVLSGSIVIPGLAVGESDEFHQVVLLGEGTGAPGFDENSVGTEDQQRLLLSGSHYECGDVILVEFVSDGNAGSATETLGLANVSVE